jgi:hypothetical protein
MVERGRAAIRQGHSSNVIRPAVNVIGDSLGSVCQRRINEEPQFVPVRHPHGGGPATGLNNIEKWELVFQGKFADQGKVEEILLSVALHTEVVMVKTDEGWFDGLQIKAKVFAVSGHHISLGAELLIGGVRWKEIDVSKMGRIALAKKLHQAAKGRKVPGVGLVAKEVTVEGGMIPDPVH